MGKIARELLRIAEERVIAVERALDNLSEAERSARSRLCQQLESDLTKARAHLDYQREMSRRETASE